MPNKTFEFSVTLRGTGPNEDAAWTNAVDAFAADPGQPESANEITEDEHGKLDAQGRDSDGNRREYW